jgi:UDP-N-acetylmuramoyl-L-alanyl-D-glutamate--2,6-diaminopimelate ligase
MLMAAGHPKDAIEKALATDPHVPGRMERVLVEDFRSLERADRSRMPLAVVDFAHTPDAVAAALKALRHNTSGLLIVVLGAGGDRDAGKRDAMGAAAAAHADIVFVTDDNPRSENPGEIRAALMRGAIAQDQSADRPSEGRIREIGDRAAAIRAGVAVAGVGDTVVVLGKGHESGQEIAGVVHPFDDRAELRAALVEHASSNKPSAGHERGPTSSDVIRGEAR